MGQKMSEVVLLFAKDCLHAISRKKNRVKRSTKQEYRHTQISLLAAPSGFSFQYVFPKKISVKYRQKWLLDICVHSSALAINIEKKKPSAFFWWREMPYITTIVCLLCWTLVAPYRHTFTGKNISPKKGKLKKILAWVLQFFWIRKAMNF